MTSTRTIRVCPQGHVYTKSSSCPTCPICENARKPQDGFLSRLGAPARRALESKNIRDAETLSRYSEKEILALHGMGPASLPKLHEMLEAAGLSFRKT